MKQKQTVKVLVLDSWGGKRLSLLGEHWRMSHLPVHIYMPHLTLALSLNLGLGPPYNPQFSEPLIPHPDNTLRVQAMGWPTVLRMRSSPKWPPAGH